MRRLYYIAALGALVLLSLTILAAPAARAEEEPAPGVARVSLIRGDVSTMRGDSGDWVATSINAPLVRGDKITTGEKSQTEIQLDHSNILRLGPRAEVRIADLTRTAIQLQVAQGLVNYTVFKENEAEIEIDTPNMAVRPVKEGSYRIEVRSPTETQLIVRKGDADVTTPKGTVSVDEGRIIMVRGSDEPEYQIAKAPDRDDWDKWNKARDSEIKDARSWKYANRYYTGAADLDRHGRWVYVSDYDDWCWTPYVNAGWIPYRYGYWGWAPYWGWTWISYEPWGWAPYHYGRWFWWRNSWCWWPGYRYWGYYPTWGPAWVSFIGFGFGGHNWHFGFGYGYSSIGWCPLGPYDYYSPWWGRHHTYNVVNITNITNVTNIINRRPGEDWARGGNGGRNYNSNLQAALRNSRMRGAITRVSTDDFVRGRTPRQQRPIDVGTLRGGQLLQGKIPVAPTRETLRPVNRPVNNVATGRGAENFFSRRQPPTVARTFNDEAAGIRQMMQRHNPMQTTERAGTPGGGTGMARQTPGTAGGREVGTVGRGATPDTTINRGRGTPDANWGKASGRGADPTGIMSRRSGQGNNQAEGPADEVRGGEQTGWRRFGQSGSRGVEGSDSGMPSRTELAQRNAQPSGAPAQQSERNPTWRRFGTGQPRAVPDRPTTTGRPAQGGNTQVQPGQDRTNWERFGNRQGATRRGPSGGGDSDTARPAPQGSRGSGFRSFGDQGQAQPRERDTGASQQPITPRIEGGYTPPQRHDSSSAPSSGWRRFGSRSDAPASADRPALELRKSITTERAAPRRFEGGGPATGGGRSFESNNNAPSAVPRSSERSAPSSSARSFERRGSGGGSRGWSAPSREYSAPSAPSRSFEGGSRGGGFGGGNRGWSAPSGGGGMRSAPSAPSRSFGGGGGGGSRGWSAPSGGGGGARGGSAPSGGGRGGSAPSRGGGNSGRR